MVNTAETYTKDVCWQYDIRQKTYKDDTNKYGLTQEVVDQLTTSDFTLQFEEKDEIFAEVKEFILKYEWLGKLSLYPTHFFTARYKGILAGVVIMDMPNAFSKMLGEDTRKVERLISRGACISWSPKNLASKLIAFSMKWMVKNTRFRLFFGYSDTEAKELGTIYQASNFYYVGKTAGAQHQYKIGDDKWTSDRYFRSRSVYKRLAKANGVIWENDWQERDRILFDKMPPDIVIKIKQLSKEYQNSCERRKIAPKHNYVHILGQNKRATTQLRKVFEKRNKTYPYPKVRGQ